MPFIEPANLAEREPLPGWRGRFFHSEHMTFGHWEIDARAEPLHEHHHEQEEVWHVVEGRVALTIDGEERVVGPGGAAIVPADTNHAARPLTACRVIVVDYPLRQTIGGVSTGSGR